MRGEKTPWSVQLRPEGKTSGQPSNMETRLPGWIGETLYFLCFYVKASHTFACTYSHVLSAIDYEALQEEYIQ